MLFISMFLFPIIVLSTVENETDIFLSSDIEYYAVMIGVERFEEMDLPFDIDGIDESAIAMYEKFADSNNWNDENIKLLLNENATKENIQNVILNWLDNKEDKDDIVLLYFAGHGGWGIGKGLKQHTWICPYDISAMNHLDEQITDVEMDSWLDELESQHVVVILDSCFSGKMLSLCEEGRVILTAGGRYLFLQADGDDSLGIGIFSYFLIQGFDGVADFNNDEQVSAEEVFRYARMPTFHFSFWKQFPFNKYEPDILIALPQLPHIYDYHRGYIPLVQLKVD